MRKHLCIMMCLFANALVMASVGNRTIQGVVLSGDDNRPLIGASVYVPAEELKKVGSDQAALGTITDMDGNFILSVPEKVTKLLCSYMGYNEQTVSLLRGKDTYRIVLQVSSHTLGDVVVTGYQELERRKLTAAVSKVEVTDAMLGGAKSIDQALAGQVAGVSVTSTSGAPGAPARIRIRGTASLNGTQDPLWVLDGMPLEGTDIPALDANNDNDITNMAQSSIAGLSPNDIENITILKDAAATAIYGARAANGVIVVTTKKGRSGKPVINFNTKLTYTPNLDTDKLNLMNSEEKINLELQLMKEPYGEQFWTPVPIFYEKGGVSDVLRKYDLFDAYRAQGWSGLTTEAQNEINRLKTVNTDWGDILFRDAFTQEYNVSISGGSEKVTYYNSLGYMVENGNVLGVNNSRFNLTSKTSYQVNKLFKVGVSIFANRRKSRNFITDTYGYANPIFYSRTANPYQQLYDAEGNYVYDYNISSDSELDPNKCFNVLEERDNTHNKTTMTSLNAIFDAELRLNDQLKFTTQLGLQWDNSSQDQYVGQNTFNMRNMYINSRYWDSASGGYKYVLPSTGGMHKVNESTTSQITWKAQGEWKRTFNEIHDVQVMAGTEIRKNWYDTHSSTGYGYDPKTLTTIPLVFRDIEQAKSYPLSSQTKTVNAFASFYANGSYTLMNRYVIGASVRSDGSDLFGVDDKYRWLPIYSFSGLWRASNEKFLSGARSWMDNLALRFSYGLQGNIDKNTSPFLVGTYGNVSILPDNTESNITIDSAPNAKLRWEKTASYNVGLDFAMLNQAVNLSVDYYYRKGTDLIGTRMLPLENGFSSMTINWASMENKGVEVNLQIRNITTKNFSWYTNLNFAYNQNKVLKENIPEDQRTPSREGYPVGAIFVLKTDGIDPETGRIRMVKKDGSIVTPEELYGMTPDDWGMNTYAPAEISASEEREFYTYAGTSDAPYTGGLMNTFNYRNWELSVNLAYYFGAHVRTSSSYDITNYDPGRNTNRDILDRWTPENTTGKFPALVNLNYCPADYYLFTDRKDVYHSLGMWVRPLNYVRLQNLRLGYRFPSEWLRRLNIGGATVALEARNLFVWGSNYHNYMDPESQSNLYMTPVPKSVTFNLSLNF